MFTYASRAVARRIVTISRRATISSGLRVSYGSSITRAVVVRGFTSSQWRRLAAKSADAEEEGITKKKTTTTTTKKSTAAAAKKTTPAKKKKAVVKKAVKPKKAKVVLTPEQKKERDDKLKLKVLKRVSLISEQPTLKPNRSWSVFLTDNLGSVNGDLPFLEKVQELKGRWSSMSESEKQHYASIAAVNAEENKKTLKDWVESHPAEAVLLANRARTQLRQVKKGAPKLADDRIPKAPATSMARFLSLNLHGQPGQTESRGDRQSVFRSAVEAWRDLPEEQKKPFLESYEQELAAYQTVMAPLQDKARQLQKEVTNSLKVAK